MTYKIEPPRNSNLEDTPVPNLFITDYMPDVPDGDFVKVYLYAYKCCREGVALTHGELAERTGVELSKVIAAWHYFAGRRIVRLTYAGTGDKTYFGIEFVDIKGEAFGQEKAKGYSRTGKLDDPVLASLFRKIEAVLGKPAGPDELNKICLAAVSWIEADGATAELVEAAYAYCKAERKNTSTAYVKKIVLDWVGKGLKTAKDVEKYLEGIDPRKAVYGQLMAALGLEHSQPSTREKAQFDTWIDEYGYAPSRLLELAEKTEGIKNKYQYLRGIIKREREAEGKEGGVGVGGAKSPTARVRGMKDRNEHYRRVREKNERAAAARLEEAYAKLPAVKAADDELSALNTELFQTLTSSMRDKQNAVKRLNKEIGAAAANRAALLEAAGYEATYTDLKYDCENCKDTGVLESGVACGCLGA